MCIDKLVDSNATDNKITLTGSTGVSNTTGQISNINVGTTSDISGLMGITTTSTASFSIYYPKTLVDARVTPETIELKYIKRARYTYTMSTFGTQIHNPDIAIKEIYGCQDGKLTLLQTIQGRVQPPYEVAETLVFDDENKE